MAYVVVFNYIGHKWNVKSHSRLFSSVDVAVESVNQFIRRYVQQQTDEGKSLDFEFNYENMKGELETCGCYEYEDYLITIEYCKIETEPT